MTFVFLAIGFVLVFEGLVLALAPSRLEAAVRFLMTLPVDRRRLIGLGAVAAGVAVLWVARHIS